MSWQQLILPINSSEQEVLYTALLEQAGAKAITLQSDSDELLIEEHLGDMPVWQKMQMLVLFDIDYPLNTLINALKKLIPNIQYEVTHIADENWQERCLADFKAMQFGEKLWICPSHDKNIQVLTNDKICIYLDPGLAFGTGMHSTTALCLTWLDQNIQKIINNPLFLDNKIMIDYGCGSGILALASVKLGLDSAYAIDNDPQALITTNDNAQKNQLNEKIISQLPEIALKAVPLVVANILANPLIALANKLQQLVQCNGYIVLSGILVDQSDDIILAYSTWFSIVAIEQDEQWIMIVGIKK